MSRRPIIDAGPGLNFLSVNEERLLIAVLGPLSAPRRFRAECCARLSKTTASAPPPQYGRS